VNGTAADDIRKRWGAKVRSRRDDRRLTQDELAAAAGCSQTTISRVELGRQSLDLDLGLKIAEALATTYDALFSVASEEVA
jgi:transcriptional regulator with XRE-family HTH domain